VPLTAGGAATTFALPMAHKNKHGDNPPHHQDPAHKLQGPVEVSFPQGLIKKRDAERQEDAAKHTTERGQDVTRDRKQLTLARWTLGSLIIYAAFAGWQACLTRDLTRGGDAALRASKDQFAKDQRPYVWPAEIVWRPLKIGEEVTANVYFLNYGKTPALRETSLSQILVFTSEESKKEIDTYFEKFDESKVSGGSMVIVPPGILPDPRKSEAFITARGDRKPINQQGLDAIHADFGYALIGTTIYYDAAGTHYRSDYCAWHLANDVTAWCEKHNEIR
jgi:hypothetical protein